MSDDHIPFPFPELVSNPEPRCPCVLLLDTSHSMAGKAIKQLNEGVAIFRDEILKDGLATQRVEVAMITFGPVRTLVDFKTMDEFDAPALMTTGDTPIGEAITTALELLGERKKAYRAAGVSYYRPWVFLITDGGPSDHVSVWRAAAQSVRAGDNPEAKAFSFFGVGVEGANMDVLAEICSPHRPPVALKGLNFRELFVWLSASMKAVSQSQPGTTVRTPPPGWMDV